MPFGYYVYYLMSPSCKILPLVPGCSHKNCYILRGSSHGCGTGACLGLLGCVPGINWFSYPINPLFWLLHWVGTYSLATILHRAMLGLCYPSTWLFPLALWVKGRVCVPGPSNPVNIDASAHWWLCILLALWLPNRVGM